MELAFSLVFPPEKLANPHSVCPEFHSSNVWNKGLRVSGFRKSIAMKFSRILAPWAKMLSKGSQNSLITRQEDAGFCSLPHIIQADCFCRVQWVCVWFFFFKGACEMPTSPTHLFENQKLSSNSTFLHCLVSSRPLGLYNINRRWERVPSGKVTGESGECECWVSQWATSIKGAENSLNWQMSLCFPNNFGIQTKKLPSAFHSVKHNHKNISSVFVHKITAYCNVYYTLVF